jgi:hypothetical protein
MREKMQLDFDRKAIIQVYLDERIKGQAILPPMTPLVSVKQDAM